MMPPILVVVVVVVGVEICHTVRSSRITYYCRTTRLREPQQARASELRTCDLSIPPYPGALHNLATAVQSSSTPDPHANYFAGDSGLPWVFSEITISATGARFSNKAYLPTVEGGGGRWRVDGPKMRASERAFNENERVRITISLGRKAAT